MFKDIDWRTATVGDAQEACGIARNTTERRIKGALGRTALGAVSIFSVLSAAALPYVLSHPFVSIETRCSAGQPVVAADIWSARRIETIVVVFENSNREPLDFKAAMVTNSIRTGFSLKLSGAGRTSVITVNVSDATGNVFQTNWPVDSIMTMCQALPTNRQIES